MADLVLVELHDHCGELALNRPARRNALVGPLVNELRDGLNRFNDDPNCKTILIRGVEGFFCAGMDLKEMSVDPAPAWRANFPNDWAAFHNEMFNCNKPIFGALEGFAIAGGSALALACDFLVVGKQSFMHVAEVERGMYAPINIAWLQLRYGYARAMELAVLGQRLYGEDLVAKGLAVCCVEDDQVLATTREMAIRMGGFELNSIMSNKRGVRAALGEKDFLSYLHELQSINR